jgi:hypothetical protein
MRDLRWLERRRRRLLLLHGRRGHGGRDHGGGERGHGSGHLRTSHLRDDALAVLLSDEDAAPQRQHLERARVGQHEAADRTGRDGDPREASRALVIVCEIVGRGRPRPDVAG